MASAKAAATSAFAQPDLKLKLDPKLNRYCKEHKLSYETLKHLKNLTREGDWTVSFDLADGYYTFGIAEADRGVFTVDYRGTLYRLARLAGVAVQQLLFLQAGRGVRPAPAHPRCSGPDRSRWSFSPAP
eukprot:jgi/Tetstr1/435398/TSEL_024307.t1